MSFPGRWIVTAALMSVQSLLALADEPVIGRLRACAEEADDAKRLACCDFEIGRSKREQNDDLGLTAELLHRKQQESGLTVALSNNISGRVVAIAKPPSGKFVVTLDNGQTWAKQEVLDFPLNVGDVIAIRRGLLGVLWMVNGNHRVGTRVHRIK